jgi:hypothetical protein
MHKLIYILGVFLSVLILNSNLAYAEMKALGKNVYMHFSDGYSSLVVVGEKGVLVVDPAWTGRAEKMKADIAGVTDKNVSHVVLTHEHYDHVGGTEVFKKAEIVCHATCQKIFDLDVFGKVPKKVTISFEDNLTIDLGGKIVKLLHIGPGDGVATTIISVPADKVVATADIIDAKALTKAKWIDDRNYLGIRKILNEISSWDVEHAITGHSDSTDPRTIQMAADFNNDLYDAVKAALDAVIAESGPGAAFSSLTGDLPKKISLPKYQDWKGYSENLPGHAWRMGMSIFHGG